MFLPIKTSVRPRRTPYTNYALIAINFLIFLLSYYRHYDQFGTLQVLREWAQPFMLTPESPDIWQFVTYAFLHGSMMHIIGNMFFLYLFGNAVNDKLGNIGYICFYLAGAVFSGLGHSLIPDASPVLGASGAVAAVTGAYLVVYPQSIVTVVYWFFFIGTFEIQAFWFIIIKMIIIDNVLYRTTPNVAYEAHLSGYAFGISAILVLMATKLLRSDHMDLLTMIRQWNRRRTFRDMVNSQEDRYYKSVKSKEVKSPAQQEKDQKISELRSQVSNYIYQHNLQEAARIYLQITQINRDHVLPRQQQLDISNQLMSMGRWEEAARAYELFLARYGNCQFSEQVELMLGVIYARYLNKPEKAVKYLKSARDKIHDSGQVKMCNNELDKLAQKGYE